MQSNLLSASHSGEGEFLGVNDNRQSFTGINLPSSLFRSSTLVLEVFNMHLFLIYSSRANLALMNHRNVLLSHL